MVASVRQAKAKLSELLERVARGEEVVITSDGKAKARLVPVEVNVKPYRVHWKLLQGPKKRGRPAEALVRDERDARD